MAGERKIRGLCSTASRRVADQIARLASHAVNEVDAARMTNVYSLHGLLTAALLICCSCAYIRRVPRLRQMFLSEKSGAWGTLYKASVIGTRLHWQVSLSCALMAAYLIFVA